MRIILKNVRDSLYVNNDEQFRFVFANHTPSLFPKPLLPSYLVGITASLISLISGVTTTFSAFIYAVLSLFLREKAP